MPVTRNDAIREAIRAAKSVSIPPVLMLALGIAESNLNPLAERWGNRQNTDAAMAALAAGDLEALDQCRVQAGNDVSFGAWQQTWRWSEEYDGTQDINQILAMREKYFDPVYAASVAATRIAPYWTLYGDLLEALCRYNKPSIPGAQNPNRPNCERGLQEAQVLLAALPAELEPLDLLGGVEVEQALEALWTAVNADIALNPDAGIFRHWVIKANRERLGSPVTDEILDADDGMVYQAFASNIIVRWTPGGPEEV
jgi:hypothetical protein